MELHRALSQISEIHAQVQRTEVFRGYRAVPMAVTAAVAVLAAVAQEAWWVPSEMIGFSLYWIGVAAVCAVVCGVDLFIRVRLEDGVRGRLATVLAQFVPSLIVGATVTLVLLVSDPESAGRLPAWWALLFGLGVFASRPYLHRAVGWVGASYVAAGSILLVLLERDGLPSAWSMGLTFGVGQLLLAGVLYRAVERQGRH